MLKLFNVFSGYTPDMYLNSKIKRAFDLFAAIMAIVILSPILVLTCLFIKLEDGGTILFKQERIGQLGNVFTIFKFRSMSEATPELDSKSAGDLQVTRVGKVIRRLNIDELPQLFNICNGSMSLVGPRPCLMSQTRLLEFRKENGAIEAKPGLTGLAQVNSFDGMSDTIKADFDAEYTSMSSLRLDIVILLKTVLYLFKPPPVY